MNFSNFADKFASQTGIGLLMEDLTNIMQPGREIYMLGGGTPSHIPQVEQIFRDNIKNLLENGSRFEQTIGNYSPPQGNTEFIEALSRLLKDKFGWNVNSSNIALTHGSQQAFFALFNMFAGHHADGSFKKILFPMAPEYIGYCDIGLSEGLFESVQPRVELLDDLFFKYRIDFENLNIDDSIGAICVSRPTNPTGNVLTDNEITKLAHLAKAKQIPLIIDNAYGKPFPDIVYTNASPYWDENCIICMSLSKLGMPGTRTGIVIGPEEVIARVTRINAVVSLAPGGIGTALITDLVKSSEILSISQQCIQPFYRQKMDTAISLIREYFSDLNIRVHKPEGAFFLWLWLKDLPISCRQFYQRLKTRGVIVVPGNYFFFGLKDAHPHQHQCVRINHAQDETVVRTAFQMMADEMIQLKQEAITE